MIRTLAIIAAVSFTLALGCFAGAFAIAGGPFSIGPGLRFHHETWDISVPDGQGHQGDVEPAVSRQLLIGNVDAGGNSAAGHIS